MRSRRGMRSIEATARDAGSRWLLATTQAASKAKLDAGRVDTVFKVGDRVLLRTKELLDVADNWPDIGKLPWLRRGTSALGRTLHSDCLPEPRRLQG